MRRCTTTHPLFLSACLLRSPHLTVSLSGLDNAGKTTILKALTGDDIHSISPTLGFNIQTLTFPPHYRLNIWDVGGQQTIRSYWRNYYEQTDGLIFVIDTTDPARLTEVRTELHALLTQERLAGASLLVMANKQDVVGAVGLGEVSGVLEVEKLSAGNRHCRLMACSAMTGAGLQEGMEWIVNDIAARIYMMD